MVTNIEVAKIVDWVGIQENLVDGEWWGNPCNMGERMLIIAIGKPFDGNLLKYSCYTCK